MRIALATPFLLAALAGCATMSNIGSTASSSEPPARPARLDIPRAHYPPPGSCRIWVPGVAPAQQSAPGRCADLERRVPAGAVLVHG